MKQWLTVLYMCVSNTEMDNSMFRLDKPKDWKQVETASLAPSKGKCTCCVLFIKNV